ncbi:hypothetical protein D3C81_865390 [compost metagenome]
MCGRYSSCARDRGSVVAKLGPGNGDPVSPSHTTTSALTACRDSSLSRVLMSRRTLALRRSSATRSRPRMSCRIESATASRINGCSITGKLRSWASAINCACRRKPSRLRLKPLSDGLNSEQRSCASSSASCLRRRVALMFRLRAACMKQPQRALTVKHSASSGSIPAANWRQDAFLSMVTRYSVAPRWAPVSMTDIEDSLST